MPDRRLLKSVRDTTEHRLRQTAAEQLQSVRHTRWSDTGYHPVRQEQ
jgi:hypothetical protein